MTSADRVQDSPELPMPVGFPWSDMWVSQNASFSLPLQKDTSERRTLNCVGVFGTPFLQLVFFFFFSGIPQKGRTPFWGGPIPVLTEAYFEARYALC